MEGLGLERATELGNDSDIHFLLAVSQANEPW